MARRRKRRGGTRRRYANPSAAGWVGIGVGAIALGLLGYGGFRLYQNYASKKAIKDLPAPPVVGKSQGSVIVPGPPIKPSPCGTAYPGFVDEGDGCVPTDASPAGIYVDPDCGDFVFVAGEHSKQIDWLEDLIDDQVLAAKGGTSSDPVHLANEFFETFWGDCIWPPPAEEPPRMIHLYESIAYIIAHEIIRGGGRVLGTKVPDEIDSLLVEKMKQIGLPPFDPTIVPEMPMSSPYPDPGTGGAKPAQISVSP
jgi:hypothetical protein